ncbi:gag-pol polyprotein [Hordeum vulgare]|nr:gag-pol polyprotein [Hordeum vulgare]
MLPKPTTSMIDGHDFFLRSFWQSWSSIHICMKFHLLMGLNNHIAKTIFHNNYESLDDIYIGSLMVEQEIKDNATRLRVHFATTKIYENMHKDSTTKMSKPDELQDDAPKFDFTAIRLCGTDDAESTTSLF